MDDQVAKQRAREVMNEKPVAELATLDEQGFPRLRPMYTAGMDEDFTIYFATHKDLPKCKQIKANPKVATSWSSYKDDMSDWREVEIMGMATISEDSDLKHRLWTDEFSQYFPEGPDDPNYVAVVVKPVEMLYTDMKSAEPYKVQFKVLAGQR